MTIMIYCMTVMLNNFWVDLSDISAKTATPLLTKALFNPLLEQHRACTGNTPCLKRKMTMIVSEMRYVEILFQVFIRNFGACTWRSSLNPLAMGCLRLFSDFSLCGLFSDFGLCGFLNRF